jgi:hypothetical protein
LSGRNPSPFQGTITQSRQFHHCWFLCRSPRCRGSPEPSHPKMSSRNWLYPTGVSRN